MSVVLVLAVELSDIGGELVQQTLALIVLSIVKLAICWSLIKHAFASVGLYDQGFP